jgi:energy-coupling factor transporter ATP-binding protein EcfA2
VPSVEGHLRRETLVHHLAQAVATERIVAVGGGQGSGKTSAVAALAGLVRSDQVWWLRLRPGLNDCLEGFLLEVGRALASEGHPALLDYLLAALPSPNLAMATRLSLGSISRTPRLIVLDDFAATHDQEAIRAFLEEAVTRISTLSVVTIGAAPPGKVVLEVPPLSQEETDQLMRANGVTCAGAALQAVHDLTAGRPGLVAAAGLWWSGDAGGRKKLEQQVAQRGLVASFVGVVSIVQRMVA